MQEERTYDGVKTHGTQTHFSDGGAREVVLVGVPTDRVGEDNVYPPPSPYEGSTDVDMRRGYFIHRGNVIAQLPRRADEFEVVTDKIDLADICWDKGSVHAYYPASQEKVIHVVWDYLSDGWEVSEEEFDDYLDEIEGLHTAVIWQNRRGF